MGGRCYQRVGNCSRDAYKKKVTFCTKNFGLRTMARNGFESASRAKDTEVVEYLDNN